jgi:hypothetical protein
LFVFSLNVNHDVMPDVWGLVNFEFLETVIRVLSDDLTTTTG